MSPDLKKVSAGGATSKKKGSSMQDAVSGTEAIRTWDDHTIGLVALTERFKTNIEKGLTQSQAD